MDSGTSDTGPTISCAICWTNPCLCEREDVHDYNCADLDCTGCLVEEEVRRQGVVDGFWSEVRDCPCGCGEECILMEPDKNDTEEWLEGMDNWAHRSTGMRCATCMWFVEKVGDYAKKPGEKSIGRCRRHAPTMNGYPVVFDNDWCGDHKLDETKT
jgi:hypothetical protein